MELMEKFIKELQKMEESDEMADEFFCLMEAITTDDEKVTAMADSISSICVEENFTTFELASMCSTLIVGAVMVRANAFGVSGARIFFQHLMTALELAVDSELKEMENGENADSTCKCE